MGPALEKAIDRLKGEEKIPRALAIESAEVEGHGGVEGHRVAEYFLILEDQRVFTPTVRVHCVWEAEAREELRSMEAKLAELPSTPIHQPVQSCEPERAELSKTSREALSGPGKGPLLTAGDLARVKIYFSSALPEGYRGGDSDYITALVEGLGSIGVRASRLVDGYHPVPDEQKRFLDSGQLVQLDYGFRDGDPDGNKARAVRATLEHLQRDKAAEPEMLQVLHIQSRYPSSGNAFDGSSIQEFQKAGVKVVVTVHEFTYNQRTGRADEYNAFTLNHYCARADRTIFLNEIDLEQAVHTAEAGKVVPIRGRQKGVPIAQVTCAGLDARARHVPVIITVPAGEMDEGEILRRPPHVMLFGRIRSGKGDKAALGLARAFGQRNEEQRSKLRPKIEDLGPEPDFREDLTAAELSAAKGHSPGQHRRNRLQLVEHPGYQPRRVVIAGIPNEAPLMRQILEAAYGEQVLRVVFGPEAAAVVEQLVEKEDWGALREKLALCDAWRESFYIDYTVRVLDVWQNQARYKAEWERVLQEFKDRATIKSSATALVKNLRRLKGEVKGADAAQREQVERNLAEAEEEEQKAIEALAAAREKKDAVEQRTRSPSLDFLPIDLFLDVPAGELARVFSRCKYAYKEDEKGMADNASSIMSCVANGCITFTSPGRVTPLELRRSSRIMKLAEFNKKIPKGLTFEQVVSFLHEEKMIFFDYEGLYQHAVVLPPEQRDLGEVEVDLGTVDTEEGSYASASVDFVLQEIERREAEADQASNRRTVAAMRAIVQHRFRAEIVAQEHLQVYSEVLSPAPAGR